MGTVLGLMADGISRERILEAYPDLEPADLDAALAYAAWRLKSAQKCFQSPCDSAARGFDAPICWRNWRQPPHIIR